MSSSVDTGPAADGLPGDGLRAPARAARRLFVERATRREGDRELPLGPKASQTRRTILEAAARVFADNGYQATTVADIAAAAGVSLGTVYQYFRDRADICASLVHHMVVHMLQRTDTEWRAAEGGNGLRRVLLNFVQGYADQAAMVGVWEEVVQVEPELAELRRSLHRLFNSAVERELRRAAAEGLIDGSLDPVGTTQALTAMVDRYCYVTYVFDPPEAGPPSPEVSADLLTRLWANAIGLGRSRPRRRP